MRPVAPPRHRRPRPLLGAGALLVMATGAAVCLAAPPGVAEDAAARPQATEAGVDPQIRGPLIFEPVTPGAFRGDIRTLPTLPPWSEGDPVYEVPRAPLAGRSRSGDAEAPSREEASGPSAVRAEPPGAPGTTPPDFLTPNPNFDGISFTGYYPPDTVGDVGPNHYIQMVNTSFAIFDKAGNLLAGPSLISSIWAAAPTGTVCDTHDDGDPIVLYDHLADRWLLSQFALPGSAPYYECVAISMTADPVSGGWYTYAFPAHEFPDYPKLAVWPDAYYLSVNEIGTVGASALERGSMLSGSPAASVHFDTAGLPGLNGDVMLPSDLDGPAPPAGTPNFFYRQVDGDAFGGVDRIEIFEFHVDWDTPASSTFTGPTSLTTAPFDSTLCGFFSMACVPQPGTSQLLDPMNEWPMWRFQYRNFATHQSLVGDFAVDVNGSNHAGIRWFELRRAGGGAWSIYQDATHSPDTTVHRWMGSVAMDVVGNMALGYSVSDGASLYPGIRYAGRLATDALGTMPHGEVTTVAGAAAQTGSGRWGDYSSLNVDPVDDCTFWYTNEYIAGDGAWRTRISAFKLCGTADLTDTDGDGCKDSEEADGAPAPKPGATGPFDPNDPNDFFDVPVPANPDPAPNGTRDAIINMGDVLAVLLYFGADDNGSPNGNGVDYDSDKDADTAEDGLAYDRTASGPPNPPWGAGPPNGVINIEDVLVALAQFGLDCTGPP